MDVLTEMQAPHAWEDEAVTRNPPAAVDPPEQAPAPTAPPEPTKAQCWEQLGRWGQAERELLAQLERVRGEYRAWLGKLAEAQKA